MNATIAKKFVVLLLVGVILLPASTLSRASHQEHPMAPTVTTIDSDITTDTTWTVDESPYLVTEEIYVKSGATLTIEPGVTVWIGTKLKIYVEGGASLIAKGTPDQHIVIDRYRDPETGLAKRWKNIRLYPNSSSYFRYVDFAYGGSSSEESTILHYEGPGTHVVNYCSFSDSDLQGITAQKEGLDLTVAGTLFKDNERWDLAVDSGAEVIVTGSTFDVGDTIAVRLRDKEVTPATIIVNDSNLLSDGSSYVVWNEVGSTTIDAENNWWGQASGPHTGAIAGRVDYTPWRTTEAPLVGITTPPTATFTVDPDPTVPQSPGTEYTFDASGSADVEDYTSSLEVCWDWNNDGTCDTAWTTEKTATHSFSTGSSDQTVRLVVRDTDDDTAEATQEIALNTPPVPRFSYLQTSWDRVSFDASSSSDAEDDDADLRMAWDFEGTGDPDTDYTLDKTASYTYTHQGRYWPTLYVKDSYGITSTLRKPINITPPTSSQLLTGTADALTSEDETVQVTMSTEAGGTLLLYGLVITHTPQLMPAHSGIQGGWLYQGFTLDTYSMFDDQPVEAISGTYTITISYDEAYFSDVLNLPFEEKLALYRWSDTGTEHYWTPVSSTLNTGADQLVATTNSFGDFALIMDINQVFLPLVARSSQ